MTTITSGTTIGITLSSAIYVNPIVVDPGVTISNIGDALYGPPSGPWTVENYGSISSTAAYGIDVAGGSVTNAVGGSITGQYTDVYIGGGAGTVVNSGNILGGERFAVHLNSGGLVSNTGSIRSGSAAAIGIDISGAAGTVVNSGSIAGAGKSIALFAGGSVTNAAAGTINGGVLISSVAGTVVNSGTIAGFGGGDLAAVELAAGSSVTNAASGSINGSPVGIYGVSGASTVINRGIIRGHLGIELITGGTVMNAGTVSSIYLGGYGNNLLVLEPGAVQYSVLGGIKANNALELASASNAGTLGNLYKNFAAVTIDSAATWNLADGNVLATGAALINNGVLIVNGTLIDAGTLTNAGSISSVATIEDGGMLSNAGSISGAVTLGFGSVLTNAANATITTGVNGTLVDEGTLTNAGNISGVVTVGGGGVLANAGRISGALTVGAGGILTNAANASIATDTAAAIYGAGGLSTMINYGSVGRTNRYGVYLQAGGSITNAVLGLITGTNYGIRVEQAAGSVNNDGTISGGNYGVLMEAGGSIINDVSGSITGKSGLQIDGGAGSVVNNDTIVGTRGPAIDLSAGGSVTNASAASIIGYHFGVYVRGEVTIVNDGTIAATGTSGTSDDGLLVEGAAATVINAGRISAGGPNSYGIGIFLDSGGSITNAASGSISGTNSSIRIQNGAGTVVNDGAVAGGPWGIVLLAGGSATNAAAGTINAPSIGIWIKYGAGTAVNDNTIIATRGSGIELDNGGSVTNAASAYISAINGVYMASGDADVVNAGTIAATSGVSIGGNGIGSVDNTGTIVGAVDGIVMEGDEASGSVVNSGTIVGSRAHGIYLYTMESSVTNAAGALITGGDGVHINGGGGTVVNSGSIAGTGAYSRPGRGVALYWGGTVTNGASASIIGAHVGIYMVRGTGTVINLGIIAGTASDGSGVSLVGGGTVTNAASAYVGGASNGVYIGGNRVGLVANAGTIAGRRNFGISMNPGGGSITNAASASITGGDVGIDMTGDGVVVNNGSIAGTGAYGTAGSGVDLFAGGTITNAASASITGPDAGVYALTMAVAVVNRGIIGGTASGSIGVNLIGGGTVTNAGTISGVGGTALYLGGFGKNLLMLDPGAVFLGNVTGGGNASNVLELASASSTGTLSGLGTNYIDFPIVTVDPGATWDLTGANTLAVGSLLINEGTLTLSGANFADAGTLVNIGQIVLDPSTMSLASLIGSGSTTIGQGSTLAVQGAVAAGESIAFSETDAALELGAPALFAGTIDGFALGDAIDLAGVGAETSFTYVGGVLTLSGGSERAVLQVAALPPHEGFELSSDNHGGTIVTVASVPPPVITTLVGAPYAGSTIEVEGTGTSGDTVTLYAYVGAVGSGTVVGGRFDITTNWGSGEGPLTLTATETAPGGATSSASASFQVLVAPPPPTIDFVTETEVAGGYYLTIDGTAEPYRNNAIEVYDGDTLIEEVLGDYTGYVAYPYGWWELNTPWELTNTDHVFRATASDPNGTSPFSNSIIVGTTGNDTLVSEQNAVDFMFGQGGADSFIVNNPGDRVNQIAGPGNSGTVYANVDYALQTGVNVDTLVLEGSASQAAGNADAAGDVLYSNPNVVSTLTGNSLHDTFVVFNTADVVVGQPGSADIVYAAADFTLPTNVDTLFLEAGTQGTGNSDASGDALYAADPGIAQTLTGNSANDTFVVYNSADVVVPAAGSHDLVYAAVSYTLPTGVDTLILEAGTQGAGNSDVSGDALYAANPGISQTLIGNSGNDTFVVYNSSDVVVPKAGSHDLVYSAVNYTLPSGVDSLILEAGTQAVGNSDVGGDTLYAANAGFAQTLTGNSANDAFVVYNSSDVVAGQSGSTDTVYAAANFTLPTNVDTLLLEGNASQGTGNSDVSNTLYANFGVASALVAGSGADTLYVTGTAGTILTGGAGTDTFAFPNVMGLDEVTNFGTAKDTLQFNAALFANFTAAMNAASQVGANTVFTIDANDTVTLDNVTKTTLTAGNFHFT
jgi:hypothetical protein